jgi:hypothetical protein
MIFSDILEEHLKARGVSLEEFRELTVRLMSYGVLCRDESRVEQQLYDRYLRVEESINEYFGLIGVNIFHDSRFAYLRLYPPGSRIPGVAEAEDAGFGGGLRSRLNQHEVALVLVLRLQYDQALREGKVDDEGFVNESLESLGIAMKNRLDRALPDKLTERRRIFQRLRQLRLIHYQSDDVLDNNEAWLRIHPMIIQFVNDDLLDQMEETLSPGETTDGDAPAQAH